MAAAMLSLATAPGSSSSPIPRPTWRSPPACTLTVASLAPSSSPLRAGRWPGRRTRRGVGHGRGRDGRREGRGRVWENGAKWAWGGFGFSHRQAGQGRTSARVPPVRALSVSPQNWRKLGPGMGRKRTQNGQKSVCSRALGRPVCPFYPKWTGPDKIGSRGGVGLKISSRNFQKKIVNIFSKNKNKT